MCHFPVHCIRQKLSTSSSLLIVWLHFKLTTNLFFLITRKPIVAIKYPILVCKIKNGSREKKTYCLIKGYAFSSIGQLV